MSELIHESIPNGCSRSYLATKKIGQLKSRFMESISSCLRTPIYSITVEYFSYTNPIVFDYWDEKQEFPNWCEHIGDIHAVCLNILSDLETDPSTRIAVPNCDWRTEKISFKTPFPIYNNKKPIFQVSDLCTALEEFDDKMCVVVRYIDSNLKEIEKHTISDISSLPCYYDGYPYNYFYTEDGQSIAGIERVIQNKVDLDYEILSDEKYYNEMLYFDRMIYTNVPASYAKERRERLVQKCKEFEEFLK